MSRVLIALPAYNEAKFIKNVLFEILKYAPEKDVLVVNDGSSDTTAQIAQEQGVVVLTHTGNRGKGAALLTVFLYAKSKKYDWIICMDSDGQHDPEYLRHFFQRIAVTDATIILGNRTDRTRTMPFHRLVSNGITSVIISLLSGTQRINDSQCGFRAIRTSILDIPKLKERGFQLESELLIQNGRSGGKVEHLSIATRYGREASSINLFKDTIKFIKLVLLYLWK